jgi:vancomycin resistance protein VanJ
MIARLADGFYTGLVVIFALAVTGFLVARGFIGEITPIALLNRAVPPLLIVAALLLPLNLLLRRFRLALLLVPAVWAFGSYYAPLFVPHTPTATANAPTFTVATYNLGARTVGFEPLIDNLLALDADIVALQELSREATQLFGVALAEAYPYQALYPREKPYYGTGVLSRFPITDNFVYSYRPTRLRLQRVQITIDETSITLFDFHAQPIWESWRPANVQYRHEQTLYTLDETQKISGPTLLLGDFNLNEQSVDYAAITQHFTDAWYAAGFGMGFTNPVWGYLEDPPLPNRLLALVPPHRRIDFIFYDHHFQAQRAQVWPQSGASDHLPVIAELALLAQSR